MENEGQDISDQTNEQNNDPFLALNMALAMLNPNNTGNSENTLSQSSEHPAANNHNDPLELLNLGLAQLHVVKRFRKIAFKVWV